MPRAWTIGLLIVAFSGAGLVLGAAIVAAAVLSVLRRREVSHLLPLGAFAALLALAAFAP